MNTVQQLLAVARGELPAELVIRNGRIVNVLSGSVHEGDIAIAGGRIVGIGAYEAPDIIDAQGRFVAPAFIDGHIHLESTLLTVGEFVRAVVPHGTCAVVTDPHEYANVVGVKGIEYVLNAAQGLPLDVFVMLSSCVPATHLETSGARITPEDIAAMIDRPTVAGVAELMNFPGVYLGWDSELKKIDAGKGKVIDGHSPGLRGPNLNAYIFAGVRSDHECTSLDEAREKLERGMHVLVREGTAERNLHDLLPLINPLNAMNFSFATDDKHPADLQDEGHIDHHIRASIAAGLDPMLALQIATINTARHYRLEGLGAIAPGYWANIVLFEDLGAPSPSLVLHRGKVVAKEGAFLPISAPPDHSMLIGTMNVAEFSEERLLVQAEHGKKIRILETVPRQIVTRALVETPLIAGNTVVSDIGRDILKLAVIERHSGTGNVGIGFVRGFGLKQGALASTVAHDAHNIIVVGVFDADMAVAAHTLIDMGGGQCVVCDGLVAEQLALPIAGIVSDQPLEYVRKKADDLVAAAAALGCVLRDPFMTLSFLALSPIPALKVTDLGLVDAERFELVSLFV